MQLIAAGQAVLFNILATDTARDILGETDERLKRRAVSNLLAMGRMVARHLDMLATPEPETEEPSEDEIPKIADRPEAPQGQPEIVPDEPAIETRVTPEPASPPIPAARKCWPRAAPAHPTAGANCGQTNS